MIRSITPTWLLLAALATAACTPTARAMTDPREYHPVVRTWMQGCMGDSMQACELARDHVDDDVWDAFLWYEQYRIRHQQLLDDMTLDVDQIDEQLGIAIAWYMEARGVWNGLGEQCNPAVPATCEDWRKLNRLLCAAGEGDMCKAEADWMMEHVQPAPVLDVIGMYVRACVRGEDEACEALEIQRPDHEGGVVAILGAPSDADLGMVLVKRTASEIPGLQPGDSAELAGIRLLASDAGWDAVDTLSLLRFTNASLRTADGQQAASRVLAEACSAEPGVACDLQRAVDEEWPSDVVNPVFGFLDRACLEGHNERACFLAGAWIDAVSPLAHGSYESRAYHARTQRYGDERAATLLGAIYATGYLDRVAETCEGTHRHEARRRGQACTELGFEYQNGNVLAPDRAEARAAYTLACQADWPAGCERLRVVTDSLAEWAGTEPVLVAACEEGLDQACAAHGAFVVDSWFTGDPDAGGPAAAAERGDQLSALASACDGGVGLGCTKLGVSFFYGLGGEQDLMAALKALEQGCDRGNALACSELGTIWINNVTNLEYKHRGLDLSVAACLDGYTSSCSCVGYALMPDLLWEDDSPLAPDHEVARWAMQRARALGEDGADTALDLLGDGPARMPGLYAPGELQSTAPPPPPPPPPPAKPPQPMSPGVTPSDPTPYTPPPKVRARGGFAVGTLRSWTADSQVSSIRTGFAITSRFVGFGMDFDWNSDNRWRPKVARSYQRLQFFANALLVLPIDTLVGIDIGAGAGMGTYRYGPDKLNEPVFSGGFHEFVQFNVFPEEVMLGIRIEQQQLLSSWRGMETDHVTAVYAVIGGRSE